MYRINIIIILILLASSATSKGNFPQSIKEEKNIHLLTYKKIFSKNYEGWKATYVEFEADRDDFIFPISFGFGSQKLRKEVLKTKEVTSVENYALDFGFSGYQKFIKGIYLNISLELSTGIETIRRTNKTKQDFFLINLSPNLGILLVPFRELGIVLGFNLRGKLSNSKVVNKDIGFEIEIGINF